MFESKWDRFYENQNDTTRAWLDAQSKETNKLITAVSVPVFILGLLFGFILSIGF